MKRWVIWTICLTMGVCFLILLYLQFRYARTMMAIRREQFNESVLKSLDMASRNMERNETMVYLREVSSEGYEMPTSMKKRFLTRLSSVYSMLLARRTLNRE